MLTHPAGKWFHLRLLYFLSLFYTGLGILFGRMYPRRPFLASNLNGKIAIITGANNNVSLSLACSLASQGATIYIACKDPTTRAYLRSRTTATASHHQIPKVFTLPLDLSDMDSVRTFCKHWRTSVSSKIDILIHNASIDTVPAEHEHDCHYIYRANFLGSFLLTYFLEEFLSSAARIVLTSDAASYAADFESVLHETRSMEDDEVNSPSRVFLYPFFRMLGNVWSFARSSEYADAKGCQVLFAKLLQRQFAKSSFPGRRVHAFSPGFVRSAVLSEAYETDSWRGWMESVAWQAIASFKNFVAVTA